MSLAAAALFGCGGGGGGGEAPVVTPAPVPAPIVAPPTRTLVTLRSDAGDVIGQGQSYSYDLANAGITVTVVKNRLSITVAGDQQWAADFQSGGTDTRLQPGMYANLDAYVPSAGDAKPGLRWYGEGRGCATSKGWFAIDSVTYDLSTLKSISLRFERHCDGAAAALHGEVHYAADDKPVQSLPVTTVPSDLWRAPAGFGTGPGNEVYLESAAGDYVGLGKTYRYDHRNSEVWVDGGAPTITFRVNGDERWTGIFKAMDGLPFLQVGYYSNLRAYPFHNPIRGGLDFAGEGRGCSQRSGWVAVDAVTYVDRVLKAIDFRFEMHCEGRAAPLHGAIHWRAPAPAVPVTLTPSPAGSWHPPAAATAAGNYLYLEGAANGLPGYRPLYLHSSANAVFAASLEAGDLQLVVKGTHQWFGNFKLNGPGGQVQAGLYDGLTRWFFPGQPEAGMSWAGQNSGCDALRGWLAIDRIAFTSGKLSAIDLRFEQVCEGRSEPMHGVLHWRADQTIVPPGPAPAAPLEAWRPPPPAVPASGNYVYLTSDRSDFVGQGTYRYTPADSTISVSESGGSLVLKVDGDEHWSSDFQVMSSLNRLQPGYYSGLRRFPFHDPARGGFDWSGEARGCNKSDSSVIVDGVSYENGQLSTLDMRFEQHCEGFGGALRGALRWSAADRTVAPGPVLPVPAGLWRPAAGATPASGNYLFLESDQGDFIGGGKNWLHTAQDAPFEVSADGGKLSVKVTSGPAVEYWQGYFVTMASLTQLQPGFYDKLMAFPIYNPARGGLHWSGMGRGCNKSLGWVAIDSVSYVNGKLTALNARFEQHCEFMTPALRGEIRWAR